ncbi:Kinesin-like protein kif3a [Chamberlinius hualienensis]
MASESVKVIVRCRPMNHREKERNANSVVAVESKNNGINQVSITNPNDSNAPPKVFFFDGAYGQDSTTEQIYNDIVYPLVEGVIEGYNGTVFAYGQTGCGKSYSMQGVSEPISQRGIIPRAFEHIFEAISTTDNAKFLVYASYLEIYNEEIRDLLGKDSKKKLDIKEHLEKGVYIPELSTHPVQDVKDCERIMAKGWKNRAVGATLMNADSSRSHSIFTVSMEMMSTNDDTDSEHIRRGKLNLVDLAGSERQTKTGASGERLREANKINLSLSALGNVISALVDGKSKHIPYRDSKLTRLLQDSLGGNTKTLMVSCISSADDSYDETLSTLRYANRAKNIHNKPQINEDPKDALLRQYQEEIKRLKSLLTNQSLPTVEVGSQLSPKEFVAAVDANISTKDAFTVEAQDTNNNTTNTDDEKKKLKMEYDDMMRELKIKYEEEHKSNAKMQEEIQRMQLQYTNELKKLDDSETTPPPPGNGRDSVTDNSKSPAVNIDEALKRLHELEEQMVGGEKVHDKELKEKRLKKKKAAEKRLKILADALKQVDEDDKNLLKVYDDIQEELKAKTDHLKRETQRVRALEREIKDLQSEFEFDRMDYLETIRRQEQQTKLLTQILDKIQPCLRRDCNFSNLDKIKAESIWDEDTQKWKLPDLIIIKTKLPPAGIHPGGRTSNGTLCAMNEKQTNDEQEEDKFLQKLERGEQEDIAGNYFKTKRAKELLQMAQEGTSKLLNLRNINTHQFSAGAISAPGHNSSPFIYSSNSLNGTSSAPHNGNHSDPSSPDSGMRKPLRLEALQIGESNKKLKRKKNNIGTAVT